MAPRKAKKRANKQEEDIEDVLRMENDLQYLSEPELESNPDPVINESDDDSNYQEFEQALEPQENQSTEDAEESNSDTENDSIAVNNSKGESSWLKHNFLHKIHFLTHIDNVKFINWSDELLQLNYMGLQDHLMSGQNMFNCRSIGQFVQQLLEVGFERVPSDTELELCFKHKRFKPNKPRLLTRMATPYMANVEQEQQQLVQSKTKPDPCNMLHGFMPKLQMARTRFHTLLSYQDGVRLLQDHEPEVEEPPVRRGRYVACNKQLLAKPKLTPALEALYVNPQESSETQIKVDHEIDYAGYYGNVNPALIHDFFGDYTPRYTARNGLNQADIVVDVSKLNAFQQNLPIGSAASSDDDEPIEEIAMATPTAVEVLENEDESQLPIEIVETAAPPDDMELEQMMDDLWGKEADVNPEQEFNPHMPTAEDITGPIELIELKPIEEVPFFSSAAEVAAVLRGDPDAKVEIVKKPVEKASKRKKKAIEPQPEEEENPPKRRRYDLRNCKNRQL